MLTPAVNTYFGAQVLNLGWATTPIPRAGYNLTFIAGMFFSAIAYTILAYKYRCIKELVIFGPSPAAGRTRSDSGPQVTPCCACLQLGLHCAHAEQPDRRRHLRRRCPLVERSRLRAGHRRGHRHQRPSLVPLRHRPCVRTSAAELH